MNLEPSRTGKESAMLRTRRRVVNDLRRDLEVRGPERVAQLLAHEVELSHCVAEWLQQRRVIADVDPLVCDLRAALRR